MDEIEHWKKRMLTLPDADFFGIMRNYLGELKTPFNKHSLIDELVAFIRRQETQERILEQIEPSDAEILSAIALLGEPEPERIQSFFSADHGYIELYNHLLNLEERLLIYRDTSQKSQRIRINPLLLPSLGGRAIHPEILFPTRSASGGEAAPPWLRDQLALAFVSYLAHHEGVLKADGSFKKRPEDDLARLFPSLVVKTERGERLALLTQALARLRVLHANRESFEIDVARLFALGELDPTSRALTLWSAALDRADVVEPMSPGAEEALLGEIERRAQLLFDLLASLDARRCYPILSVERILAALAGGAKEEGGGLGGSGVAQLLSGLIELEILIPSGKSGYRKNPAAIEGSGPKGSERGRRLVVQPNFVVTVTAEADFLEAAQLAIASEITTFDVYPQYEITKRSYLRGLDLSVSGPAFRELLERANGALPQNVRFSLESWEGEYAGIGLFGGIVLTADEKRRHLIDHSETLRPLIRRVLAPGVYLFDPNEREEWQRLLEHAGVGPLPQIQFAGKPAVHRASGRSLARVAAARPLSLAASAASAGKGGQLVDGRRRESITRDLLRALEAQRFPDELKAELSARIKKKLILFPGQITNATPRSEKSEAKGLDYIGKVRLIEQAMKSGNDLLEIIERSPKGSTRRLLVKPSELRRSGDDLLLFGSELPAEAPAEVRVRKIVMVRKLKSSLYAP